MASVFSWESQPDCEKQSLSERAGPEASGEKLKGTIVLQCQWSFKYEEDRSSISSRPSICYTRSSFRGSGSRSQRTLSDRSPVNHGVNTVFKCSSGGQYGLRTISEDCLLYSTASILLPLLTYTTSQKTVICHICMILRCIMVLTLTTHCVSAVCLATFMSKDELSGVGALLHGTFSQTALPPSYFIISIIGLSQLLQIGLIAIIWADPRPFCIIFGLSCHFYPVFLILNNSFMNKKAFIWKQLGAQCERRVWCHISMSRPCSGSWSGNGSERLFCVVPRCISTLENTIKRPSNDSNHK